jgi:hypothetical protein
LYAKKKKPAETILRYINVATPINANDCSGVMMAQSPYDGPTGARKG